MATTYERLKKIVVEQLGADEDEVKPEASFVDDLNADGWDDIFIASGMNFPFRYGINSLLLNEAGKHFLPSEFVLGVEPRANGATQQVWFTLDCRGRDAFHALCGACAKGLANGMACQVDSTGHLTMMGALGTRAAVALDLDNDGDLDIVTNEFNGRPQILVSDLAQRHQVEFLKVRLRGTRSNRDGLGATVRVRAGSATYSKYNDGKSGYLSQSDVPLYFGLGDAEKADRVEILWPSGRKTSMERDIPVNGTLRAVEPR